jgi:DNA-binding beta-propeller fold protein YncE
VVGRYPLPGAEGNHGLLIEPTRRLAFIACEGNARLLVLDLRTKEVVSSHLVGAAPDVLAFDPDLAMLYVASESGVLSVFKVADREITKVGESRVAPRAHSVAVAPDTHRVYLPLENVDKHPVLRVMEPTQ